MGLLTPDEAPLLCQGCGAAYPPDPEDSMGRICWQCNGPLMPVSATMVMGKQLNDHRPPEQNQTVVRVNQ